MLKAMSRAYPRPLVVLDCDATAIQEEVIELLAAAAGALEEVAEITDAAMHGELDFHESLHARVHTLAGLPDSVLETVARQVTLSPGLTELVAAVHARDGRIGVVSGGFIEVLDRFLPATGIDIWHANSLEIIDGTLTGRVAGPVVDAHEKARRLESWASAYDIPLSHTVAIGDGANDLEMMRHAAISVGFNPKPIVRQQATVSIESSLDRAIPLLDRLGP